MLIQILFFLFLLTSLFLLSQKISAYIYSNVFVITKNKNLAIGVLLFILLPGTIIHEISHFLIATILRVPTGELTVIPTIGKDEEIKAGKLFLGETDPFRLSLIGLAPMIIGLTIIYFIGNTFFANFPQLITQNLQPTTILSFYLLFITSITMFSSKKDMKGLVIAAPIILILFISLYFVGIRIFFDKSLTGKIELFLSNLNYYLAVTAVINFSVFLLLLGNLYFWSRFLGIKNRGSSIQ